MQKLQPPQYNLMDIRLDVGDREFEKAYKLYKSGAVSKIRFLHLFYEVEVKGTHVYEVCVGVNDINRGNCTCYVAQKDQLCKHMIALANAVVQAYGAHEKKKGKMKEEDSIAIHQPVDQAVCSGEIRDINDDELKIAKAEIQEAMKNIKAYTVPSSKWFQYQDSLQKGSRMMLYAFSKIPICEKSVLLCIQTLIKLDKKLLNGGVDDSDGTVGELMIQLVEVLNMFVDDKPDLKEYILKKLPKGEVFDWETYFMPFDKAKR